MITLLKPNWEKMFIDCADHSLDLIAQSIFIHDFINSTWLQICFITIRKEGEGEDKVIFEAMNQHFLMCFFLSLVARLPCNQFLIP